MAAPLGGLVEEVNTVAVLGAACTDWGVVARVEANSSDETVDLLADRGCMWWEADSLDVRHCLGLHFDEHIGVDADEDSMLDSWPHL